MTPCALPQALPISCKDCPAFQRLHMSFRCCSESLNRLLNVINTTFKDMTYSRWCCIDRLSRQVLSERGHQAATAVEMPHLDACSGRFAGVVALDHVEIGLSC